MRNRYKGKKLYLVDDSRFECHRKCKIQTGHKQAMVMCTSSWMNSTFRSSQSHYIPVPNLTHYAFTNKSTFSTLKMAAADSPEALVPAYQIPHV